ncbi:MAG: UDP-2,3-diacylglucosamine diphosphatase LpxI [Candidatus Binatia bacterium]
MAAAPLGLIAGNGVFPRLVARGAREAGVEVVAVAHVGETEPELEGEVRSCTWVRVGELGKIIRTLKNAGCERAVMAGGIKKARLFSGFRPDLRGAAFLARMRTLHDDKLLRGIAGELESDGIRVIPSTEYLPRLVPSPGVLSKRAPKAHERSDIDFGVHVAKAVGSFEIGQTVVVKNGLVLAVEAVEGTDAAIRRGGELARGGAIVVKVSKPQQDLRFDVPAIGPETIRLMAEVGATVLAIEAGRTIILEREQVLDAAAKAGIAVVAVEAPAVPPTDASTGGRR